MITGLGGIKFRQLVFVFIECALWFAEFMFVLIEILILLVQNRYEYKRKKYICKNLH